MAFCDFKYCVWDLLSQLQGGVKLFAQAHTLCHNKMKFKIKKKKNSIEKG